MRLILLCLMCAAIPGASGAQGSAPVAAPTLDGSSLTTGWRTSDGDDFGWAQPDFDDSSWDTVPRTDTLSPQGTPRWFRRQLRVDPNWPKETLAMSVELRGSLQLFVDGRLALNLGSLPGPDGQQLDFGRRFVRINLPDRDTVQLAIRYRGHPYGGFEWTSPTSGFRIQIGNPNQIVTRARRTARVISGHQWLFIGLFAGQALLHALLFLFWRAIRSNLFFSLTAIASALLVGLQLERPLSDSPAILELTYRLWGPVLFVTMLSLLLFAYELFDQKKNWVFWTFIAAGTGLGVAVAVRPEIEAFFDLGLFHLLLLAEVARVIFLAVRAKWSGAWILALGITFLGLSVGWQLLLVAGWGPKPFGFFPVSYYGVAAFFFSASVYLAFHFARLGQNLREQLEQVEALSARTLEQELAAKEREVGALVLAQDNKRKTAELQEARDLQNSMLPPDLPDLPGVAVAATMMSATEVAGDYYDFKASDSGVLTAVIADVTGHGARAGAMVSLVKGMFTSFSETRDPRLFLNESSESLRAMRLPGVHIAMAVARLRGEFLSYTSAGMPPAYILRADTGEVEELLLEALPLGALPGTRYLNRTAQVASGDTVLLLSDGLPELLDESGDALGYRRVERCLSECRDKSPRQTIEHLERIARSWAGGPPYPDDLTFIVLKIKNLQTKDSEGRDSEGRDSEGRDSEGRDSEAKDSEVRESAE